jgi:hypothetical protein
VALASVVLVVAAAGAAFGFTDDSSVGSTFVTAATALNKAGCAAGFGDGSFGYNGTVTRGQDAIFQIACAPGIAYRNDANAAAIPAAAGASTAVASLSFTAGINPGGLQYILVRGSAITTTGTTITPAISVSPAAGGTAVQPPTQTCRARNDVDANTEWGCEAGFVVPTGVALNITFSGTPTAATTFQPSTVSVNSAPRGNTASSLALS